jgi:hypothetical protein
MAHKTFVSFSLDTEADRDILHWLERQGKGNKSKAIRDGLREHINAGGVTLGDVYQAVKDLERRMQAGATLGCAVPVPEDDWDEPPDVAATLDALGEL